MIALDSSQIVEVVLDTDKAKPNPPTFLFRHLTAREWMRVRRLLADAPSAEGETGIDKLGEAISVALWGWRNIPGVYDGSKLPDLLTFAELWELAYGMLRAMQLSEIDQKKSVSQSASGSGPAVGVAETASV